MIESNQAIARDVPPLNSRTEIDPKMLTRRHVASAFALLLLPMIAQALPPDRSAPMRHYILESEVPLDAAASAELAAEGILTVSRCGCAAAMVSGVSIVPPTASIAACACSNVTSF